MKNFKIILILFVSLFAISCVSKRSTAVQTSHLHSDSSFTHTVDTSAVSAKKESQLNITEVKTEATSTRTTEYNDSGTVVRIIETIVLTDYQRADLSQIFERKDALSGISTITTTGTVTQSDSTATREDIREPRTVNVVTFILRRIVGLLLLFVLYKLFRKYVI